MTLNTIILDKDGIIKAFEAPDVPEEYPILTFTQTWDWFKKCEAAIKIPFKDQHQIMHELVKSEKLECQENILKGKHYHVPESYHVEVVCNADCDANHGDCCHPSFCNKYAILVPKQEPVKEQLCNCVSHTECECIYENKCSECGLPLRPTKKGPKQGGFDYAQRKQETRFHSTKQPTSIEEAAKRYVQNGWYGGNEGVKSVAKDSFIAGAKHQEAKEYERALRLIQQCREYFSNTDQPYLTSNEFLFEQFKQENK